MLNLLIGFLLGMIAMDILWAMKTGTIDLMRIRFKIWLLNKKRSNKKSTDVLNSLAERK